MSDGAPGEMRWESRCAMQSPAGGRDPGSHEDIRAMRDSKSPASLRPPGMVAPIMERSLAETTAPDIVVQNRTL